MFRLAAVPTMKRTVTINVPDPDKVDVVNEQKFTVHFRVLTRQEADAFDKEENARSDAEKMRDPHTLLRRVIIGWGDDVEDEHGAPVPFTAENLEALLALPWAPRPLYDEYSRGLAGEPRLGN